MSNKNKASIGQEGIYDARQLGVPKMILLGMQHTFAMFGATVLVPIMTGLNVSTTLLMAGLGTLLFHLVTKGKVPAFLGSSFAFLGGYAAIAPNKEAHLLPYACFGASSMQLKLENGGNVEAAKAVGTELAKRALEKNIKAVVFDRGGYIYHGRVKALADAAREAGLEF